ncbi:UNVERIFIED_CONTAM: Vinorine synthase [Sesamum angustifolium]|uniref:Vinorine synthase n=1 Tax=Sesamum angustifolium TaxID=2727405 RepID=A0AAW2LZJ1_9LAMI
MTRECPMLRPLLIAVFQVITNPVVKNMDKLLPRKHKIANGSSFFLVANSWAAVARNGNYDDDVPGPKFEGAKIFAPQDPDGFKPSTGIVKEELVTKIFTFPASKISALQERYSGGASEFLQQRRPTQVEALSAFIWTRLVSSMETKADPNKIYTVLHAVNLRTRLDPPLSEYHFSNIYWLAKAMPTVGADSGTELFQKLRKAIRGVNGEYMAQLQQGNKHLNFLKERMAQVNKGQLVTINFTSWCGFPLYEADFGRGKPVWVVTFTGMVYKNLVVLMDTVTGDGIEARIN